MNGAIGALVLVGSHDNPEPVPVATAAYATDDVDDVVQVLGDAHDEPAGAQ